MSIFERADSVNLGCIVCSQTSPEACPACNDGEICSLSIQTCTKCAEYYCALSVVPSSSSSLTSSTSSTASASSSSSGGPSSSSKAGIAGGISAGIVVLVAIIVFAIWRVFFSQKSKRRQAQYMRNEGTEMTYPSIGINSELGSNSWENINYNNEGEKLNGNQRVSVSTMGSLGEPAFSRTSNIIPIAYPPGATNQQPSSFVNLPRHGFSADDILRGSVVSQTPIIRDSLADYDPRQSNIVVSSGAMTAIQVKPNLVQLKNQPTYRSENRASDFSTLEEGKTISQFISNGVPIDGLRDSMASISTTASFHEGSRYYQAEPAVEIGSRANARSIRIGKSSFATAGLQNQNIPEELGEEESYQSQVSQLSGELYNPNLSSQSIHDALMQGDIPINLSFDTRFSQFSSTDSNQGENSHNLHRGAEDEEQSGPGSLL
ncbi:hypothetical protein NADFUDRAFT_49542 [Nadsonia fulvescens var. elongata DSM 6958]|uniref:Membrane anchor Opy2 N-terminal domain-containing protein n=1 Tax=Nadsonia fulvescens var. elongata DSM 6958 TaxID=857566 RepID=A0A1E3PNU5_9ASCO|nr:hypothetical protein NADFUDRAFT_49542 [Nadsonia fulvescens var. elongata DSM 6958]